MPPKQIKLMIQPKVSMRDIRGTLQLARMATEILYGSDQVALDGRWEMSRKRRVVMIHTETKVGHTFALVFMGFARREFGRDAVQVSGPGLPLSLNSIGMPA